MDSLFIGHAYIDLTMMTDHMPTGDEKTVAQDYAISFGGNAVTAGFACAKLGHPVNILTTVAADWLGHMFLDMANNYGIHIHPRRVNRSSLSFVLPNNGKRAIVRARDDTYQQSFPKLDLTGLRLLHLDGHMSDAALAYAKIAREKKIPISLDGGALRPGIEDLCSFVDIAVVSDRLCEQMGLTHHQMLEWLLAKGVSIGAVTNGSDGMLWYDESRDIRHLPALKVPASLIIDTSGAGDVFHGAYCASFLERPQAQWQDHFDFARVASAFKIQHLGNEAGLPTQQDIVETRARFSGD